VSAVAVSDAEVLAGVAPRVATVRRIVEEAFETYTYWVTLDDPVDRRAYSFEPGQINMIGIPGVGEIPISVSSDPARPQRLAHTIRACGSVTNRFRQLSPGDKVTLRGPFGRPWPMTEARGGDLLIVAGGVGLAPVRSAIYRAMRQREMYRRVLVLVGARGPEHMLFRRELETWMHWMQFQRRVETHLAVDVADDTWPYTEGVVTTLFPKANIDPKATTVFTAGPEIMMWFAARGLLEMGVPERRLWLTMERNMHCAVRLCGHCQLGPYFVCADGPVFRWDEVGELMAVEEL
jgi:NAD(P)H-flavin reductase